MSATCAAVGITRARERLLPKIVASAAAAWSWVARSRFPQRSPQEPCAGAILKCQQPQPEPKNKGNPSPSTRWEVAGDEQRIDPRSAAQSPFRDQTMSLLGNILWLLIGGGFITGCGYIWRAADALTIIGIPFGMMDPPGLLPLRAAVRQRSRRAVTPNRSLRILFNIAWLLGDRGGAPCSAGFGRHHHHRHPVRAAAHQADPAVAGFLRSR